MTIRRNMLRWMLPGFVILWICAGVSIFWNVRQRLESRLDEELREIGDTVAFGGQAARSSALSFQDIAEGDHGIYFQIWGANKMRVLKSRSLGQFELERPTLFRSSGEIGTQILGQDEKIRTLAFRSPEWEGIGPVDIIVAKSQHNLATTLVGLVALIVVIGAVAVLTFALLLRTAISASLRPLIDFGKIAEKIDAEKPGVRFPTKELPEELDPIVEKLNNLVIRQEESFSRERRFSADLAHELRTPVAALKSIAEVALKWPDRAEAGNYQSIKQISEHLEVTIENMLMLARIENAGQKLECRPMYLREVTERCWQEFESQAGQKRIQLKVDIDEDESLVSDANIFQMIISNLLSNAVEYSPEGSEICVAGRDGNSNFSISNRAPFLTESDLPLLFDRYWRHDTARSDMNHSGLGLSLAKVCADLLEFELSCEMDAEKTIRFAVSKYS